MPGPFAVLWHTVAMRLQNDFRDLQDVVSGRLSLCLWDISSDEVVGDLSAGMPNDGAVHIFSDEWHRRMDQVRSFVMARAGMFDSRVGARCCDVRQVDKGDAADFIDAFHIQGINKLGVVRFGLYLGDDLVGLLSLGRHSRGIAANRIVLDRLCFRRGVQVIGGASKLMKAARAWAVGAGYDEIITFSDNRLTDGGLYESMGFVMDRRLRPDYFYVRAGERFSKQSQSKTASKCPHGMTEREWATKRGMRRVYDAGKVRWLVNLRPGEHETRNEASSRRCAERHQSGDFDHFHMRGVFRSSKSGDVYFSSSYELRCMYLLDDDDDVVSFARCESFSGPSGWRNPDLRVNFVDGRSEIWEIKPSAMVDAAQQQISDSMLYARETGSGFRVWTEADSGLQTDHAVIKWAREHLSKSDTYVGSDRHKKMRKAIRDRHYAKLQADRIEVQCDFCQTKHVIMGLSYRRNVKKNGRYICPKENGSTIGARSKDHLHVNNPYADEGKKQCSTCKSIMDIGEFHVRRASWDGLSPRCRSCCKKQRNASKDRRNASSARSANGEANAQVPQDQRISR